MKKIFMVTWVMACLFITSPTMAQYKYTLYLGETDTGVTTPKKTDLSGVTSPLIIGGGNYDRRATDITLRGLSSLPSGNAILYIDTVTVGSVAQAQGGTNSGNTFFVSAKFGHAGSNFDLLEPIPLVVNMALSGPSPYGIPFSIPPGTEAAKFYFGPSGLTNYGNFKGSLVVGISGSDWTSPDPFLLDTLTYTISTISGASLVSAGDNTGKTIPPGTRGIVAYVNPVSGTTVVHDIGAAPTAKSFCIEPGGTWVWNGPLANHNALQFDVITGTQILTLQCYTGKPY